MSATCRACVSLQVKDRSSVYSHTSRVRHNGAYLYEDFMPTDGTDVKVRICDVCVCVCVCVCLHVGGSRWEKGVVLLCVCMHECVCACAFVLCVGGARWKGELFFHMYMCALCLSLCVRSGGEGGFLPEYFVCV